jgi:hypothetical protein
LINDYFLEYSFVVNTCIENGKGAIHYYTFYVVGCVGVVVCSVIECGAGIGCFGTAK